MNAPHEVDEVRIRRAPKIPVFLILGGGFGAVVTFILTGLFPADPEVGFGALFGYFSLYGIPAGVVLGAVVALILDRRSQRRSKTVTVEREVFEAPEQVIEAEIVEPEPQPEYEAQVVETEAPAENDKV